MRDYTDSGSPEGMPGRGSGYAIESELLAPAPRSMPDFVYESRYVKNQKQLQRGLLIAAIICLIAQFIPPLQRLALYVLPLGYAGWLAVALLAGYLFSKLNILRGQGPLRYLTHGEAIVGIVETLVKQPTLVVNGSETQFSFVAGMRVIHPETGEETGIAVASNGLASSEKDRYDTTLKIGDQATLVYFPGKFDKSVKVYGFLDLNPAAQYITKAEKRRSAFEIIGIGLAILAFCGLILAAFSIERYEPLKFPLNPLSIGVIAAGAIAGLLGLYFGYRHETRAARTRDLRNAAALAEGRAIELGYEPTGFLGKSRSLVLALLLIVGAPGLCGAITWSTEIFLNGLLDHSEPELVPVRLGDLYVETHSLIFRQYKVEFWMEGQEKKRTLSTTPEQLFVLDGSSTGVAVVKDGFFGWPWVQAILPGNMLQADSP